MKKIYCRYHDLVEVLMVIYDIVILVNYLEEINEQLELYSATTRHVYIWYEINLDMV